MQLGESAVDKARLAEIRERWANKGPWCEGWMYGAIRHCAKNVDYDALCSKFYESGEDEHECQIPDRGDGTVMAHAPQDISDLLGYIAELEAARVGE